MATLDVTLLVFAVDIPGAPYKMGDIVDVGPRHNDGCGHERFVLVHVEGIPLPAPAEAVLKRLKSLLESTVKDASFDNEVRRRAWRLDADNTSTEVMSELVNTRETIITWERAKLFLGRRIIIDESSPELDQMLFITEDDV